MAKRYSEEYKKNLVAQYKAGISVQNICISAYGTELPEAPYFCG